MSSPPRRTQAVSLTVVLVAALGGCSHPPQGTDWVPPGPFTNVRLAATELWSGGDLTVISPSFKSLPSLLTVQVGGAPVAIRRINDSTVAATLPDADATLAVHVAADSFKPFDASITVHGFQQMRVGPIMPGMVQALPGQAAVIGAGAVGLIEVNLRTNTIQRQFPDTVHSIDCARGVGPSVVPGHFVFAGKTVSGDACFGTTSWAYGAIPTRTSFLLGNGSLLTTSIAEISSGGTIWGSFDNLEVDRCGLGICPLSGFSCRACAGSLTGATIGALAQRAVMHSTGHMVFNTATGDSVFKFPFSRNTHLDGAVFSLAEDTVYAIGRDTVIMAKSADGTVYRSTVVSDATVSGIGRDEQSPWIYVLSIWNSNRAPQLTVLDRATLATVAVVRAPASAILQANDGWDTIRFVRDPAANRLFAVVTVQDPVSHTQTSRILSYGVPSP